MGKSFLINMVAMALVASALFVVPSVYAADGSVTTPLQLCSYLPKDKPQCATSRTTTITVPQGGAYRFEVVVERGNHMECQDQESFFMTINGQRTPMIADPGPCEAQGTVTRQNVEGTYTLNAGANTIVVQHAYTLKQARSIESLTIMTIDAISLTPKVNGVCGSADGQTLPTKPTTNLCSVGAATAVSGAASASAWAWACVGTGGGTTVQCDAKPQPKPQPKPQCGSANGKSYSVAPTTGLCSVGNPAGMREVSGTWQWECGYGDAVVACSATKARVAIAIDKSNGDKSGDTQTVKKGGTATFTIRVMNSGDDVLTHVVIDDPLAPDCNRSAAQTAKLYGATFDPKEVFSYTCTQENVQKSYTNLATATAMTMDGKTKLSVCDDSDVRVKDDPVTPPTPPVTPPTPPVTPPEPPVTPPKKPTKEKCDASIGDLVWNDTNKNGIQDNGERGIADVRLKLYNGDDVERDKTNSTGKYKFKDLCEGTYTVVVDTNTLPQGCYPTYDYDGKLDHKTKKKLDDDEHFKKADFGYYCPTKVTGATQSPKTGVGATSAAIATGMAMTAAYITNRRMKKRA